MGDIRPRPLHTWVSLIGVILICLCQLMSQDTWAQTAAPKTGTLFELPAKEQIEKQIAALESGSGLDEGLKSSLLELYRRTLASLGDIERFETRLRELNEAVKSAPKRLQELQKTLEQRLAQGAAKPQALEGLGLPQLEQRLNQVIADAAAKEIQVNELAKQLETNQARPGLARERLGAIKQSLEELEQEIRRATPANEPSELTQAKRWALEAQRQALVIESRLLEQELVVQPTEQSVLKLQHDLAALDLRDLKAQQRALEEQVQAKRAQQAQAEQLASERAQRAAEDKHPVLRSAIQRNAELSAAFAETTQRLAGLRDELTTLENERKRIESEYRGAKQRLEAAGLTRALGQVLLDQRNQLPDLRQYRAQIRAREDQIAESMLRQIRYREEERQLHDLEHHLDELALSEPAVRERQIRRELGEVLKQRLNLLRQVLKAEEDYLRQLGELNYAAEQLVQVTRAYADFLAENLLWVRSAGVLDLETLKTVPSAFLWLISASHWQEVLQSLGERLSRSPGFWLGLALGLTLLWKQQALRGAIRRRAESVHRVRTDSIRLTLEALGLTLLAALPSALLLWTIGQQLTGSTLAAPYTRALGAALAQVAPGLYCLSAFRMLCIRGGVADRHFRWKEHTLGRIRLEFGWFILYAVPLALVTATLYQANEPIYAHGLGRIALIASLLGCAVFFARLLHPAHGALKHFVLEHPGGWTQRSSRLWFTLIVGIPLALAVLALAGYLYTAGVLFQALFYQLCVVLGLILVQQTIVRWLTLTRRRIAFQNALARRGQGEAGEAEELPATAEPAPTEAPEPDLASLDEQTRQLINAAIFIAGFLGFWATWSEILPALGILERFALWHYTATVNGTPQQVPVTLADLGAIILILLLAAVAIRNLPALLEILLLQSSLSPGARYTVKTLSGYGIAAVATILTFSTLGLSWGQIQWLVAALGVGIGFGLQEIIGNFISGLIILFERPVRVGDIVTIGETTGVVTNIRIRATTIRNWDRQELLVPNKEFITGRLLNWTLSDQQNRITIVVGIEYGSDVKKALNLLEQVARNHPKILSDPGPLVGFEGFGENALMLKLRCYMGSLEGRIGVITDLNLAIYEIFRAEGISIAFPQREVRLYTPQPLAISLRGDTGEQKIGRP